MDLTSDSERPAVSSTTESTTLNSAQSKTIMDNNKHLNRLYYLFYSNSDLKYLFAFQHSTQTLQMAIQLKESRITPVQKV